MSKGELSFIQINFLIQHLQAAEHCYSGTGNHEEREGAGQQSKHLAYFVFFLIILTKVRKPAEAEKYKLEKLAEAERLKIVLEAEALAESLALKGEAEAFAIGESV